LYGLIGMGGLFVMTGVLALLAIVLLLKAVPPAPPPHGHAKLPLRQVAMDPDLLRLNLGIFVLHMVQMSMFVVLPHALVNHGGLAAASHWKVYLPAVLVSFVIMVPAIIAAERKDKMRPVFLAAIALLVMVQSGLLIYSDSLWALALWLMLFFVAFNILKPPCHRWFHAPRHRPPRVPRSAFTTPRRPSDYSSAARQAVILRSISAIMQFLLPALVCFLFGWWWQVQ
jgi:Na+/melibiose symporter-like transporter